MLSAQSSLNSGTFLVVWISGSLNTRTEEDIILLIKRYQLRQFHYNRFRFKYFYLDPSVIFRYFKLQLYVEFKQHFYIHIFNHLQADFQISFRNFLVNVFQLMPTLKMLHIAYTTPSYVLKESPQTPNRPTKYDFILFVVLNMKKINKTQKNKSPSLELRIAFDYERRDCRLIMPLAHNYIYCATSPPHNK